MVESPVYRSGEGLQPWQRSFVSTFVKHREIFGKARLLLADEVGLGKTLSMATAALVSCLLGDGPVLILCPATLTEQWQIELKDHLGISSARWVSSRKQWVDSSQRVIRDGGAKEVGRCPFQIGIVSTGLITQNSKEAEILRGIKFGTVILDEAHKARAKRSIDGKTPSNLGAFMAEMANKSKNIILGTATPIQTDVSELWDLMEILSSNAEFVLGRENVTSWKATKEVLPLITGKSSARDGEEAWNLLRSPLPRRELSLFPKDKFLFDSIRNNLAISDNVFFARQSLYELDDMSRSDIENLAFDLDFFRANNPFTRHIVFRQRRTLEEKGLLVQVGVNVHPNLEAKVGTYKTTFEGLGLMTSHAFTQAYQGAEDFSNSLKSRGNGASLFRALFLQRICSSFASGLKTVERIIARQNRETSFEGVDFDLDQEEDINQLLDDLGALELDYLDQIRKALSREGVEDPKLKAVKNFLELERSQEKSWLEWGCIVFSQYFDTVEWIANSLAETYRDKTIAVYAGGSKSGLYRNGEFAATSREQIKSMVKSREVMLVVATDAACEGLNLQTLGTLINIDLPWNPSRLEQRLGRIKRFGQERKDVDMLNLVYKDTQDEKVYKRLSERMKDRHDIFGSIPDCIDDEWIDDMEQFTQKAKTYLHLKDETVSIFERASNYETAEDYSEWHRVLSRHDIESAMDKSW